MCRSNCLHLSLISSSDGGDLSVRICIPAEIAGFACLVGGAFWAVTLALSGNVKPAQSVIFLTKIMHACVCLTFCICVS